MNIRATRRFRILHGFYFKGGAVQHWFSQRVRPAGMGALLLVALGSFMSVGQPRNSVFLIFCFSFAMVALAFMWVIFRRAKLEVLHSLPRHATVGEILRYSVRVRNAARGKLRSANLLQTAPDSRPTLSEFASIREPGEEQRNLFDRFMVYYRWQWLLSRKRSFFSTPSVENFDIEKGETKHLTLSLTPLRRGVIAMDNIRVLLPDPLGFFQKCKPVAAAHARLVVLPKRYLLPSILMPGSAAFRIGGEETSNVIGNSGEFVGLREYRPGDPLRQIHWKSWAHTGRPMVKELEDTFYPRYALILDTFPGSPDENIFEEMVSVAASFIVGLDRSESLLDLMFIAGEAHTVTAGRGIEKADKLLEVLAGVHCGGEENFALLNRTVVSHREQITSCLLVLNGWDKTRANFVTGLVKSGILCVPLVIGSGPAPSGVSGHWLESGQIPRDLLRLPKRLTPSIY